MYAVVPNCVTCELNNLYLCLHQYVELCTNIFSIWINIECSYMIYVLIYQYIQLYIDISPIMPWNPDTRWPKSCFDFASFTYTCPVMLFALGMLHNKEYVFWTLVLNCCWVVKSPKLFLGGKYQFTYFDVYVAYLTSPGIFLPNGKI